jgi:membrane dipeptidase
MDYTEAMSIADQIHANGPIVDLVSPLLAGKPEVALEYLEAGVAVVGASLPTSHIVDDEQDSLLGGLAGWKRLRRNIATSDVLTLITRSEQLREVADGKVGLIIQSQNSAHFEGDADNVYLFYELGQRVSGLAYNIRNQIADGAFEPADAGLSVLGRRAVRAMNQVGMVIDGAHTGRRSTLEAMAMTQAPFIFSHSGAMAVHRHPRNITDDQIRECAATGGVVGVFAVPHFLTGRNEAGVADMIRHIRHIADLVGPESIGIGMDYLPVCEPYLDEVRQQEAEDEQLAPTRWRWKMADLPRPPWKMLDEVPRPSALKNLTAALLLDGFGEKEVAGIMGGNFCRVFDEVWQTRSVSEVGLVGDLDPLHG